MEIAIPPTSGPRDGRGDVATSDFVPGLSVGDNQPPDSAKKSQQFGRTIRRAYFSANCFPVTRIMTLAPQTHCPFGCCVVRDMWKTL